jgi:hypothetical protein
VNKLRAAIVIIAGSALATGMGVLPVQAATIHASGSAAKTQPATASTRLSPAASTICSISDEEVMSNYYGFATDNYGSTDWEIGGMASGICIQVGAGEDGYDHIVDYSDDGLCVTWNGTFNTMYDATCGRYPAAQSWEELPEAKGTVEIWNYYASKCLAGNTDDATLYLYVCAPNGDRAQDWTVTG